MDSFNRDVGSEEPLDLSLKPKSSLGKRSHNEERPLCLIKSCGSCYNHLPRHDHLRHPFRFHGHAQYGHPFPFRGDEEERMAPLYSNLPRDIQRVRSDSKSIEDMDVGKYYEPESFRRIETMNTETADKNYNQHSTFVSSRANDSLVPRTSIQCSSQALDYSRAYGRFRYNTGVFGTKQQNLHNTLESGAEHSNETELGPKSFPSENSSEEFDLQLNGAQRKDDDGDLLSKFNEKKNHNYYWLASDVKANNDLTWPSRVVQRENFDWLSNREGSNDRQWSPVSSNSGSNWNPVSGSSIHLLNTPNLGRNQNMQAKDSLNRNGTREYPLPQQEEWNKSNTLNESEKENIDCGRHSTSVLKISALDYLISKVLVEKIDIPFKPCNTEIKKIYRGESKGRLRLVDFIELQVEESLKV